MFTFKTNQANRSMFSKALVASALTLALSACSDDDNTQAIEPPPVVVTPPPTPVEYSYTVTVTNLTNAQPLSPIAVLLHGNTGENAMWKTGARASVPLEKLAEGGDNADFLADESAIANQASDDVVLPGMSTSVIITSTDLIANYFTVATMLVNTNDAFSGLTGIDISSLAIDENKSWNINAYDSGTELNNEAAGTMPGPADGGIGYDSTRDDVDFVGYHSGVVSQDDGLSSSVLTQAHRFDNPVIKVTIIRTK